MQKIQKTEELISSAARQGVTVCGTEAEVILGYIKAHGYELMLGEEFKLSLHDESAGDDHGNDEVQTIRDIVELCKELNEEMLLDSYSTQEPDADAQLELRKDNLIFETLLAKAAKVQPPTVRRYDVVIVEHLRMVVPVMAASWNEAKMKVQKAWENGEYILDADHFAGVVFTSAE